MKYSIEKNQDDKYLTVKYVGLIDSSALYPVALEASTKAKKFGINRFLIDLTEARRKQNPFEDNRHANQKLAQAGINRGDKIALLVNPEDHSHDFYENRELAEQYLS